VQFDATVPTIRDRVVQTAAKLVLEPVFEADFDPEAYGYRPGRSALDAVRRVHGHLKAGYTDVVDADLSKYLDHASYCTQIHEAWLKRSGCEQLSLRRRPFWRPRLTWMASISPRLTRCHTVCRETPSRRMVWYMVRYPSGASSATRAERVNDSETVQV
jgi:retron-type reverse transcriptase